MGRISAAAEPDVGSSPSYTTGDAGSHQEQQVTRKQRSLKTEQDDS